MWLFANDFKHIIYHWKIFFSTSMNSRLLPQNKAPFRLDQLVKCVVTTWKNVSTIRAFSPWTKDTIVMRRPWGIGWHLDIAMGVARDNVSYHSAAFPPLAVCSSSTEELPPPYSTPSGSFPPTRARRWASITIDCPSHRDQPREERERNERERGGGREGEREAGRGRGRRGRGEKIGDELVRVLSKLSRRKTREREKDGIGQREMMWGGWVIGHVYGRHWPSFKFFNFANLPPDSWNSDSDPKSKFQNFK